MLLSEDLDAIDEGVVLEIEEYENAYRIVMGEHHVMPEGSMEFGFTIFKDGYTNFPIDKDEPFEIGDYVELRGFGTEPGLTKLAVNGEVWFDYTPEKAILIGQIRRKAYEIQELQNELGSL